MASHALQRIRIVTCPGAAQFGRRRL